MACATLKGACSHVLASARPALACRANAGEAATCCSSSSHEAPRLSPLGSVSSRPCSRILGERERDPCCLSEQKPGNSCPVSSRARASGSVWTTASSFFGDGGDAGDGRSALCSYAAKKKTTATPTAAGDHGGNLLTATLRNSRRTGDISFSSSSVHGCRVASLQGSSDEGRCQQRNHVHRSTGPRAVLHVEKVETSLAAAAVAAVAAPPPAWPGFVEVPEDKKKWAGQKPIALIGSTGSIGTQTLDIVNEFPEYFRVVALAAGSNITLLAEQIRQFKPSLVSVSRSELIPELKEAIADVENKPEIVAGPEGLCAVAAHPEAVTVVTGVVGCAGLPPTVAAIKAGKDIALANKETLIAGGPAILPLAHEHGVKILPADSEHSAIFQCLQGLPENGLRRIILTASGGAFRDWPVEKLKTVKVADALKHPNWSMGKKITIDSASLMNKGLEVIEAHYLFGADYDNIDVVVHPQSIIHSMVETQDSSILAQLGWPDMRLPIIYTLSWPQRIPTSEETWRRLDFIKMGDLTFREPDRAKYPSLDLAYAAGRAGGTMTGVLSAANEKAVELFIEERISYLEIMRVIEMVCVEHMADLVHRPDIDSIIHFDLWARQHVEEIVSKGRLATAAKL